MPASRKYFFVFLYFLIAQPANIYSQITGAEDYYPLKADAYKYSELDKYRFFLDSVLKINSEETDKKIRKDYKEIISEKNTDLVKELSENNFLFDSSIHPYLNAIFFSIVHKNNLDSHHFHFFVSRSSLTNAYSFDDCSIVCNLGLLNIMENESQIAMVFCHELAHYLLKHATKSIIAQLEKYNSPEFISRIKAIKKEKYNTKSKLEDLLVQDVFNRKRHHREFEVSADSLGILLYLKTGYNPASIPRLFDLLNADEEINTRITLGDFFSKEEISVDEKLYNTGNRMTFGKPMSKSISDSLKTHPDCLKRKQYAIDFLRDIPANGYDFKVGTKEKLADIKKRAFFEQTSYSKDKKDLGLYLYLLIQGDVKYGQNDLINTNIFNAVVLLTIARQNHALYTVVDKPYTIQSDKDEYAKLLRLLDTADLQQLQSIAKAYYNKNKAFIHLDKESSLNFDKIKQF